MTILGYITYALGISLILSLIYLSITPKLSIKPKNKPKTKIIKSKKANLNIQSQAENYLAYYLAPKLDISHNITAIAKNHSKHIKNNYINKFQFIKIKQALNNLGITFHDEYGYVIYNDNNQIILQILNAFEPGYFEFNNNSHNYCIHGLLFLVHKNNMCNKTEFLYIIQLLDQLKKSLNADLLNSQKQTLTENELEVHFNSFKSFQASDNLNANNLYSPNIYKSTAKY